MVDASSLDSLTAQFESTSTAAFEFAGNINATQSTDAVVISRPDPLPRGCLRAVLCGASQGGAKAHLVRICTGRARVVKERDRGC